MNDKEQVTMLRFQNKQLTAQLKWFEQTYGHKARDTEGCVFLPSDFFDTGKKGKCSCGLWPKNGKAAWKQNWYVQMIHSGEIY